MRRLIAPGLWVGFLLAGTWLISSPAVAQDVVAVLSSDSPAYREALAGFEETFGHSVPTFTLPRDEARLPNSVKVIVAFGGKAATHRYPEDATLVYCLTPAFCVGPDQHAGPRIRVYVAPRQQAFLAKLKEIQPNLRRMAVFEVSQSPAVTEYLKEFTRAARANGIEAHIEFLSRTDDLPDRLRSLAGKIDALWMPPDPLLVTPTAFAVAKEFGRSNNTPFYAPMDSLVDKGATASYAASFRESGRAAGRIAAKAAVGALDNVEAVYPERYELTINLTAAAQSGLTIAPDVIKKADRVVP